MKLFLFLVSFAAQTAMAQMYQGQISKAAGMKYHLKNSSCYIYVHQKDSKQAQVTFHYGSGTDFFTQKIVMDQNEVYVGERLLGYQYGFNQSYFVNTIETSFHYILKLGKGEEAAKMVVYYNENDGNFFNNGKHYQLECRAQVSEKLK